MTRTVLAWLASLPLAWRWAAAGIVGLWGLYSLVFFTAGPYTLPRSSLSALVNVLPLAGLALIVQRLLGRAGGVRPLPVLMGLHLGLASAFSVVWYVCVITGLGMLRWFETGDFLIQPFSGPALPWQCFQGLALYTAVAALCHALRKPPPHVPLNISAERYLMKVDDALIPIQVADIVSLQGAHDYVQLTTPRGTHLVRHGLSEFGAKLNPDRFVRIHRSVLVNLDYVERVEMLGGGKYRVLLNNGVSHTSSRAGAQILRAMVL